MSSAAAGWVRHPPGTQTETCSTKLVASAIFCSSPLLDVVLHLSCCNRAPDFSPGTAQVEAVKTNTSCSACSRRPCGVPKVPRLCTPGILRIRATCRSKVTKASVASLSFLSTIVVEPESVRIWVRTGYIRKPPPS